MPLCWVATTEEIETIRCSAMLILIAKTCATVEVNNKKMKFGALPEGDSMTSMEKGIFAISLDFELYWGVQDLMSVDEFKDTALGARTAIPQLLELFEKYEIHATWATVGFLFFENERDLSEAIPEVKPVYLNKRIAPYEHIKNIGSCEGEDPIHYAAALIKTIRSFPHQEIASHTFSHYYCLEKGQNILAFRSDLEAALSVALKYGVELKSIVFPRNQINNEYLAVCKEFGITAYRGNRDFWAYSSSANNKGVYLKRGFRLLDSYINLSGHGTHSLASIMRSFPYDVKLSRSLRAYSRKLELFEPLRLRRIEADLTFAAENGLVYHLGWHPHNFGADTEKNLLFLEKILKKFASLQEQFGIESLNMEEIAERLRASR